MPYTNPKFQGGHATYAIIIGVSHYQHLPGGSKVETPNSYGLGQLSASATTAFRLFQWLRDEYRSEDSPLEKCWLLLSPQELELQRLPEMKEFVDAQHDATFENCRRDIGDWWQSMNGLPRDIARGSKALFYFVGHGIEVVADRQLLLPTDYLSPPLNNTNTAISSTNIRTGLSTLNVIDQLIFIDACRNDNWQFRGPLIQGEMVLPEPAIGNSNPEIVAPVIFACAPGAQAFMPANISDGNDMSLFGQELLAGLRAQPNLELSSDNGKHTVNVYPLQKFLNQRLTKRFQSYNMQVRAPVRIGGGGADDLPITEIQLPISVVRQFEEYVSATDQILVTQSKDLPDWNATGATWGDRHDVLGSEQITEIWETLQVFHIQKNEWIPPDQAYRLTATSLKKNRSSMVFTGTFKIPAYSQHGYCLQLTDHQSSFMISIPGNYSTTMGDREPPLFDIILTVACGQISQIQVALSDKNVGLLKNAAQIWQSYLTSGLRDATKEIDKLAVHLLSEKAEEPLAALIAAIVLMRSKGFAPETDINYGAPWVKGDWLRNLSQYFFSNSTDAHILWMEQCFRHNEIKAGLEALRICAEMPLPATSECLSYALIRTQNILDDEKIQGLYERLNRALPYTHSDGLFATYVGPSVLIEPHLVLP